MLNTPVFSYCSRLYLEVKNDRELILAIAEAENFVICFASLPAACKYRHAERFFGYMQLDAHKGGFISSFPASLMEEPSTVGLTSLLISCDSDTVMSSLAVEQSAKIDWGH